METEQRYKDSLTGGYDLLNQVMPHLEELRALAGKAAAGYRIKSGGSIAALDIGCGSGGSSRALLSACPNLVLEALDSQQKMLDQACAGLEEEIRHGRCRPVLADALEYLAGRPQNTFDIIASVTTLHNMTQSYRASLYAEIFRVLKPGGLFINADKYTSQDEEERFKSLVAIIGRIFDAFGPAGRLEQLREWVLHNIEDQSPERTMRELDSQAALNRLGFLNIDLLRLSDLEAVLIARKPGD